VVVRVRLRAHFHIRTRRASWPVRMWCVVCVACVCGVRCVSW
jgi:hypothetical protein